MFLNLIILNNLPIPDNLFFVVIFCFMHLWSFHPSWPLVSSALGKKFISEMDSSTHNSRIMVGKQTYH